MTTTKSLWEITEEWKAIEAQIEACEGDISDPAVMQAVDAALAAFSTDQAHKVDAYVAIIRKWEGEAAAADAESERYWKAAQVRTNRVVKLKQRLLEHMQTTGQSKIESATGRVVSIAKNGGKTPLIIDPNFDTSDLPARYQHIEFTVDTEAVREDLDKGVVLAFAQFGERGVNLRIK